MPVCSSIYRPGPSSPVSLLPAGFFSIVLGRVLRRCLRVLLLLRVPFYRFPVSMFSLFPFVFRRCSPLWCRLPSFSMFPVRAHPCCRLPWGCALSLTDLFPSRLPSRYSVVVGRGGGGCPVGWWVIPWRGVVSGRFAWRLVFCRVVGTGRFGWFFRMEL